MPEEKKFFFLDLFLTKCVRIISCLRFLQNTVLGDFSIKQLELPPVFGGVFVYSDRLGVIYCMSPRRPIGVWQGEGGQTQGVLPAFYWSPWSHI
jgi:hypothetical protein